MATTKVKGVVLGSVDVKEKDKLINIYTLDRGKMTVSMRGVRGDKAKLKGAKELFCLCDFIIEEGKTNIVTGADIIESFFDISGDIDKFYEGCAILDVVSKVTTDQPPNPALFMELVKALQTLCYDEVNKYYIVDKFLMSVFTAMGYQFLTDYCSACGSQLFMRHLNLAYGELVCPACKDSTCVPMGEECYNALKLFVLTDYDKLKNIKVKKRAEVEAFSLLRRNFEHRTGGYQLIQF